MLKKFLLASVIALAAHSQSWGAFITYNFGTASANGSAAVTAGTSGLISDVTFGNATIANSFGTVGTPIATTSASSGYTAPVNATGQFNIGQAVNNAAFSSATSPYFSFVVNNASGNALTLDSFGFGSRSTATGATLLSLRSSVDGFASDITTFTATANSTWVGFNNAALTTSLGSSASVELRVYASGGASNAGSGTINTRLDDVSFNVSSVTAVPEPTSLALLGMAGCTGLVAAYRRRKTKRTATV